MRYVIQNINYEHCSMPKEDVENVKELDIGPYCSLQDSESESLERTQFGESF